LGAVKEFYFDDKHWTVRYLVADTGGWLSGRQVLLSPHAVSGVDRQERVVSVRLTKKRVEDSPSLDADKPVSKQFEESYHSYYGWPVYWSGPYVGAYPQLVPAPKGRPDAGDKHENWDPHLRSTRHLTGHTVVASDGEIGHVDDFVIDDDSWAVRYLIVATHNWWPGKKVLISPRWIESINWDHMATMQIGLRREAIRNSPEYTEQALLTRDHEAALHRHYGLPEYRADASARSSR
jgi:uncharacterized protein YrrD